MPRHSAPNHPHCFIDCPGGGFAYYVEPLGPCVSGCDVDQLAQGLFRAIAAGGWAVQSCGAVRRIRRYQLADLAGRLRRAPPGPPEVHAILDDLEQIGAADRDSMLDAEWDNLDVVDLLKALRDAAGKRGGTPSVAPLTPSLA